MTDQIVNPLMNRIRIPGEHHTLPSRGLFYEKGVLSDDVKDGELLILPTTTQDEIYMRSPDMLFSGESIRKVFARTCPQVLKPGQLLSKDTDFILTVLRKISYGDQLEITYNHGCTDSKEHNYPIKIENLLKQIKRIDPTTIAGKFTMKLENEQIVKFAPIKYDDVVSMLQLNITDSNRELPPEELLSRTTSYISSLIESVDNITDKKQIEEWLEQIPPKWTRQFQAIIDATQNDWGVDFNVNIKCEDCGKEAKIVSPISPLFFFYLTIKSGDPKKIENMFKQMASEARSLVKQCWELSWFMRGGLQYFNAFELTPGERDIGREFVEGNIEAQKKSLHIVF